MLSGALERQVEERNELEREGTIQRFKYTLAINWLTCWLIEYWDDIVPEYQEMLGLKPGLVPT